MKPKALVLQAHGSNRDFDVMEALTHPNIVQMFECGEVGEDFLFITLSTAASMWKMPMP